MLRIDLYCQFEVGQSGSWLLHLDSQYSQIVVRVRMVGLDLQNGAVHAFGILQPACPMVRDGLLEGLIYCHLAGTHARIYSPDHLRAHPLAHFPNISRYASSTLRANPASSISGRASIS